MSIEVKVSLDTLKLALEALVGDRAFLESDTPVEIWGVNDRAITALRQAIEKAQKQEPVYVEHWVQDTVESGRWAQTAEMPRHVAEILMQNLDRASLVPFVPPQRQPMTDEQRMELWRTTKFRGNGGQIDWFIEGTRAAEAAHGITSKDNT